LVVRRVFFSFHYANDIYRVHQVRNIWLTQRGRSGPWFEDGSLWEKAATQDDDLLRRMIDLALNDTSVTIVLIGSETAHRKYVTYEIEQSLMRGHGLLGVYIHHLRDANGKTSKKGLNPLDRLTLPDTCPAHSTMFETYDWVDDDGYHNLGRWVEAAARKRLPTFGTSPEQSRYAVSRFS
jgi:hypothetical protein